MPPPRHVFAFAFVCLFLAVSPRLAAAQPPSLTGIEVAPGGGVTVRGSGTAGARYNLYRTDALGTLPPWGEAVGSGLAGTNGQFAVEDADASTAPAGFYCVSEKAVVHRKVQLWAGGPYWAETNVGAEEPWEYGFYFWWGDTVGYRRVGNAWVANDGSTDNFSFLAENTPSYNMKNSELKAEGWLTEDNVLTPAHDAAHVHWGGGWRIPTHDELNDLCYNKCDWSQATANGVNGFRVRGRGSFAGASIFLPAVGALAQRFRLDGLLLVELRGEVQLLRRLPPRLRRLPRNVPHAPRPLRRPHHPPRPKPLRANPLPETFFQSLENARKIFPIIGKIARNFPTIGKIFSNHWKTAVFPMRYQIGQNPVA